jgi:hypothetical protein
MTKVKYTEEHLIFIITAHGKRLKQEITMKL